MQYSESAHNIDNTNYEPYLDFNKGLSNMNKNSSINSPHFQGEALSYTLSDTNRPLKISQELIDINTNASSCDKNREIYGDNKENKARLASFGSDRRNNLKNGENSSYKTLNSTAGFKGIETLENEFENFKKNNSSQVILYIIFKNLSLLGRKSV